MRRRSTFLVRGFSLAATFALLAACGSSGSISTPPQHDPELEGMGVTAEELGASLPTCASGGYTAGTKTLALTLTSGVSTIVVSAPGGKIAVNGNICMNGTTQLTTTSVAKITITGTSGADKVVFDMLPGSFGTTIPSATGGVTVDLAGGTDAFMIRGTSGADKFTMGTAGSDVYAEITNDKIADIKVSNAESFSVSTGANDDTFTGAPAAGAVTSFQGGAITLGTVASAPLTVYGGAGNDVLQGGGGADFLYGGDGNDTFKTAATADGGDTYSGDANTDTVDYSLRSAAITVTIGAGTTDDGASGEADDVLAGTENLIGGSGDDVFTGDGSSNVFTGNAGNDTLGGGVAGSSCASDVDVLNGNAGDDTFVADAATDCADTLNGGDGNDLADYSARSNVLHLTLDVTANDGETSENDNIKADVEAIKGGTGNDVITGSANDDSLDGFDGDDVISGGAGNDTLVGGVGNDVLNGGAGVDIADYSAYASTDPVTITACADPAHLTGAPAVSCVANDGMSGETDNVVNCEWIKGGAGDDTITASSDDTTIEGGAGADTLTGGAGNDTIFGDAGDDVLAGGAGDDYLEGGAGDDSQTGLAMDGGSGDGDVCITDSTDTVAAVNCEL